MNTGGASRGQVAVREARCAWAMDPDLRRDDDPGEPGAERYKNVPRNWPKRPLVGPD